jgi:hypothetical protein
MANKKTNLRMVLLSVDDFSDGRKVANHIEGSTYKNKDEALKDILSREVDLPSTAGVGISEPTDFMEFCNDQEINLEQFWVSYIFIEE